MATFVFFNVHAATLVSRNSVAPHWYILVMGNILHDYMIFHVDGAELVNLIISRFVDKRIIGNCLRVAHGSPGNSPVPASSADEHIYIEMTKIR